MPEYTLWYALVERGKCVVSTIQHDSKCALMLPSNLGYMCVYIYKAPQQWNNKAYVRMNLFFIWRRCDVEQDKWIANYIVYTFTLWCWHHNLLITATPQPSKYTCRSIWCVCECVRALHSRLHDMPPNVGHETSVYILYIRIKRRNKTYFECDTNCCVDSV